MRGLDPRIHRKNNFYSKVMDCRVKPGNDARRVDVCEGWYNAMDFSALLTRFRPRQPRCGQLNT